MRAEDDPQVGEREATLEMDGERPSPAWQIEGASCLPFVRSISGDERIVVGSGTGADLRVFDRSVSGRHCALHVEHGRVVVEDLDSKNGVFVGGARVERAYLGPGAAFVVGRVVLSCRPSSKPSLFDEGDEPCSLPGVVVGSLAMRRVVREALRFASVKGPLLLRGETGTGKDILARAIHAAGPRHKRPFVPLNVGTLPRELAPRELTASGLARLASYGWPGNVRELRNVLYRAALATSGPLIGSQDVADSVDLASGPSRMALSPDQARAVVNGHGGNVSAAARQLGVARSAFRGLLHR